MKQQQHFLGRDRLVRVSGGLWDVGFYSCCLSQAFSSQSPHTPVLTSQPPCSFSLPTGRPSEVLEFGRAIHKAHDDPEGPGWAPGADQEWESTRLPSVSEKIFNYTNCIYFCWMDFVIVETKTK